MEEGCSEQKTNEREDLALVEKIVQEVVDGDLNECVEIEKGKKGIENEDEEGKGKEAEKAEGDDCEDEGLDSEEDECGNVEYKRQLVSPSPSRLVHLVTQLKWRLGEGKVRQFGMCFFYRNELF